MRIFFADEEEDGARGRVVATGKIMKTAGGPAMGALTVEKEFAKRSLETGREFPQNWFPFGDSNGPAN